jgi:hypothetical protein
MASGTHFKKINLKSMAAVGVADSTVTITGITTSDEILNAVRLHFDTTGIISSVKNISADSATISAANTVKVTGNLVDSDAVLFVFWMDMDA